MTDKFVDKMLEEFVALYRIRKNLLDNELDRWKKPVETRRKNSGIVTQLEIHKRLKMVAGETGVSAAILHIR